MSYPSTSFPVLESLHTTYHSSPVDWFKKQFSQEREYYDEAKLTSLRKLIRRGLEEIDPGLVGKKRFVKSGQFCCDLLKDLMLRIVYLVKRILYYREVAHLQARDQLLTKVGNEVRIFYEDREFPVLEAESAASTPEALQKVAALRVEEAEHKFGSLLQEVLGNEFGRLLYEKLFQGRLDRVFSKKEGDVLLRMKNKTEGTMKFSGLSSKANWFLSGTKIVLPNRILCSYSPEEGLCFKQDVNNPDSTEIVIKQTIMRQNLEATLISLKKSHIVDGDGLYVEVRLRCEIPDLVLKNIPKRSDISIAPDPTHRGYQIVVGTAPCGELQSNFPTISWHVVD